MNSFVNQMVKAPTARPCLVQIDWGMISPKMTMARVAKTTARAPPPPVMESRTMVRELLTRTLPRSMEHSRKLPLFLTGRMALAYCQE